MTDAQIDALMWGVSGFFLAAGAAFVAWMVIRGIRSYWAESQEDERRFGFRSGFIIGAADEAVTMKEAEEAWRKWERSRRIS